MRKYICYVLMALCLCFGLQGCSTATGLGAGMVAASGVLLGEGISRSDPFMIATGAFGVLTGAGLTADAARRDFGMGVGHSYPYYPYNTYNKYNTYNPYYYGRGYYNGLDQPIYYYGSGQMRRF